MGTPRRQYGGNQDRREDREPRPLCRVSDGRSRHSQKCVRRHLAAHRGTAAAARQPSAGISDNTMITLALLALLLGWILAQFFKVSILVPASCLLIPFILVVSVSVGDTFVQTALKIATATWTMPFGYALEQVRLSLSDYLRTSRARTCVLPDGIASSSLDVGPWLQKVPRLPADAQPAALTPTGRSIKRMVDLGLALTGVALLFPLMVLAAVAIKLDSSGPVIFRQRRSGLNSNQFTILKFRTMKVLEDGSQVAQACRDDPRVTPIGRFLRRSSIDELPQLFNVIKGEMSLVGPRPHALAHDCQYESLIPDYSLRRCVKPGMTGWAQVNGLRGETERLELMIDRVNLDLWYTKNWSLRLDLYIISRTFLELIGSRAY
jgi:lipopolysaccharide/colanic/teichoic acid biosynthesis glycosyltransferase